MGTFCLTKAMYNKKKKKASKLQKKFTFLSKPSIIYRLLFHDKTGCFVTQASQNDKI